MNVPRQQPTDLANLKRFRSRCRQVLRHNYTCDVAADLDFVFARSRRRFDMLEKAKARGRRPKLAQVGRVLKSRDVRWVAAITIAAKYKQKLTLDDLRQRVAQTNPWRLCPEPITALRRVTGKGKVRLLYKFGPLRSALQWIVAEAVRSIMPDCPHEYACRGRGRDAAIGALTKALNEGQKDDVVIVGDLASFFPSIPSETVWQLLPLPRSVITNCLYVNEGDKVELGGKNLGDDLNKQIRNGLPQGALSSGVIARYVMHAIIRDLTQDGVAVSYVDDFAIGPVSVEDGQAIIEALHSRAKAHLTGPRQFKTLKATPLRRLAASRLNLLGYRFRRGIDGNVRVTPTPHAMNRFTRARLIPALRKARYKDLQQVADKVACAFRASQRAWDYEEGAATFEARIYSEVACEKATRAHKQKMLAKKGSSPFDTLAT
jgi:hypothetical protein